VENNGHTTYIDFVVTNPGSKTNVALGSAITPLAAAKKSENKKITKYSSFLDAPPDLVSNLVPFALEITGRFGAKALAFIKKVCKLDQLIPVDDDKLRSSREWYFRRVSTQLARNRASLLRNFFRSISVVSDSLSSINAWSSNSFIGLPRLSAGGV
jgi:hypothetical protein